jgi:mRNA interferase MazF
MTISELFDVVVVLFPFTDMERTKPRPALVLSRHVFNETHGATVLAMITTAARSHWPSDVPLRDLSRAGLTKPSVVRLRLFTLENEMVSRRIGTLAAADRRNVQSALAACFGSH